MVGTAVACRSDIRPRLGLHQDAAWLNFQRAPYEPPPEPPPLAASGEGDASRFMSSARGRPQWIPLVLLDRSALPPWAWSLPLLGALPRKFPGDAFLDGRFPSGPTPARASQLLSRSSGPKRSPRPNGAPTLLRPAVVDYVSRSASFQDLRRRGRDSETRAPVPAVFTGLAR